MLKKWLRAEPLESLQMGLLNRRTQWLNGENCPLGAGEGMLEVEICENPWTTRSRELRASELVSTCTCQEDGAPPISQRQKFFCSGPFINSTSVLLIWLLICILYDQLVSVSKMPSWVWWTDLVNYTTQGGCPGSPLFIASRSEVCAAYYLQLASEIEVVLWDWA